jgi:hypothetical protein
MDFVNENKVIKERILSVDDFKKQETLESIDAKLNMFINLLLMKKCTISRNPEDGIDLLSYIHKRDTEDNLIELSRKIEEQIKNYIPEFLPKVDITKANQEGDIDINITSYEDGYRLKLRVSKNAYDKIEITIPDKDFNR